MTTFAAVRRALSQYQPSVAKQPHVQTAAVALILASGGEGTPDLETLFIRRAVRADDPWSGQVGLPGGRRDPGDRDLAATAVRETLEEVSVDLRHAEQLGVLDDIYPKTIVLPPVVVRPFVFALPIRPQVIPSTEVQSTFWVSLENLVAPGVRRPITLEIQGAPRTLSAYTVGQDVIWGMTERILTSFLDVISPQK